jgi:FkbM family methyltransferase
MASPLIRLLKPVLSRTVYRQGAVATIRRGPAKGLRYRIFPQYGLAPLYGGWEPDAQALMVKHLRPGAVAYDVGANYGIHALLMARLVGETGRVYAFEPVPAIQASLRENVAFNGFNNVTPVSFAADDHRGQQEFLTGIHGGAGHLAAVGDRAGERLVVETISLDEFAYGGGNRPPNFMKIDIEGAEVGALRGATRILREARPVLLMNLHGPDRQTGCGRILADAGYDLFNSGDGRKVVDLAKAHPDPQGVPDQLLAIPKV